MTRLSLALRERGLPQDTRELLGIDPDWEFLKSRLATFRGHNAILTLEPEMGSQAGQEIVYIPVRLKAEQIVLQHRFHQFAMFGYAL